MATDPSQNAEFFGRIGCLLRRRLLGSSNTSSLFLASFCAFIMLWTCQDRPGRVGRITRLLLPLLFLFFPLFGPCSRQRELKTDVAFVARILHELFLIRQPPHYEFYAIRFRPGCWIIHRESVKQ